MGFAATAAAVVLAGCGSPVGTGLAVRPAAIAVEHDAMDLRSEGGRFNVVFQGLKGGYKVQATRQDIAKVRITLTSPRLLEPMVKVVDEDELNQVVVTVPFTNVPAGDVQVMVQAIDKDNRVIGAKQSTSAITNGQTTVLQMAVRLDAATGSGDLATVITFEDPTPAPTATPSAAPTASPSPSPTPTPTPSAAPVVVLESSRLVRRLIGNPEVEITLKNPTSSEASARVYMYFYNDNTLKDSQAREIPLGANERMTFRIKSNAYFVNKVNVVVK
jgi:hypothetical protein